MQIYRNVSKKRIILPYNIPGKGTRKLLIEPGETFAWGDIEETWFAQLVFNKEIKRKSLIVSKEVKPEVKEVKPEVNKKNSRRNNK